MSAAAPPPSVAFVSHNFGYDGDLMYFGEIFRALRAEIPGSFICVNRDLDFINPHALDLRPILKVWPIRVRRRTGDGQEYEARINLVSPSLLWRLLRLRPDVIVTIEFTMAALWGTLAALLLPCTGHVLLIESDPARRGASRNRFILAAKGWLARRADVVQTNDDAGRRYAVNDLGVDAARIVVAPYLTSHPPAPPETGVQGATGDRLRLLFANSLTRRKGLDHVLAALALLSPDIRARLHLTVVGDGPERDALQSTARTLGLGATVTFVGHRHYASLGQYYADADALIVPSRVDYRSLASFEGLAYGLALLVSQNDGAAAETVEEGGNGHRFDPEDHEALAAHITALIEDREMLSRYRSRSTQLFAERYSLDRVARNIADSIGRTQSAR